MILRFISLLVLLLPTAWGHYVIYKARDVDTSLDASQEFAKQLPQRVGTYRREGEPTPAGEGVLRSLYPSKVLMQGYSDSQGFPYQLTIVHSDAKWRGMHFPEVCITGSGWEVREQRVIDVGFAFAARRIVIHRGLNEEAVLYWFRSGDRATDSFFEHSFNWALERVTMKVPKSTLVRVSTPIIGGRREEAFRRLEQFALRINPEIDTLVS